MPQALSTQGSLPSMVPLLERVVCLCMAVSLPLSALAMCAKPCWLMRMQTELSGGLAVNISVVLCPRCQQLCCPVSWLPTAVLPVS